MLAWFTLLIGLAASLLFGTTAATPVQVLSTELQANRTANGLQATKFTNSFQILLCRRVVKDYYWESFLGPYGVKVGPCPENPKPFSVGASYGIYHYGRNDIDNPPHPPAMEVEASEWMGHKDCKWKTKGGGDVGQFICGDWMIMDCERDASWNDGAINCHGWSYHRAYACNF